MSPPESIDRPAGPSAKAKPDIYFMMLVLSFLALVIGTVCLILEVRSYNWDIKGTGAQVRASQPPALAPASQRAIVANDIVGPHTPWA
ncbi:MAG: hypothetical protein AB7U73_02820 [Pirellulales bacterium]